MKKFKTEYNQGEFPDKGEVNELPSKTKPEQAFTMSEMLRRISQGLPLTGQKVPVYDPDDQDYLLPDIDRMDLAERQTLLEETKAEVERLRAELNQKAAEKRAEQKREADKKALEEYEKRYGKVDSEIDQELLEFRRKKAQRQGSQVRENSSESSNQSEDEKQ